MSQLEHLEAIEWPEVEEKILDLIPRIEPWLRGNEVENAHGILEIWTDQMDQTTQEIRRLMYEGCAEYALIRTTRQTTTPHNLLFAVYTILTVDMKSNPAIGNLILKPATSVWVEKPADIGANITFLIVKPARLLLGAGNSKVRNEETLRQRYLLEWYRNTLQLNSITHVCPSPTCRQGYKGSSRLKGHFTNLQNRDHYHHGLAAYQLNRAKFVEAMQECIGWDAQPRQLPDNHESFEIDFLAQMSLKGYLERNLKATADKEQELSGKQSQSPSGISHTDQTVELGAQLFSSEEKHGPIVRTRCA